MLCVIDNYDSFTYNLVHMFLVANCDVKVFRNDEITKEEIIKLNPEAIAVSPGPGKPEDSEVTLDAIEVSFQKNIPLLGVCLGHQAIAYYSGGKVVRGDYPVHGKADLIYHDGQGLFKDVSNPFKATRYHSLVVLEETLPEELEVNARNKEGVVMAIRHKEAPVYGVQFHPESFLTEEGEKIIKNFLKMSGGEKNEHQAGSSKAR